MVTQHGVLGPSVLQPVELVVTLALVLAPIPRPVLVGRIALNWDLIVRLVNVITVAAQVCRAHVNKQCPASCRGSQWRSINFLWLMIKCLYFDGLRLAKENSSEVFKIYVYFCVLGGSFVSRIVIHLIRNKILLTLQKINNIQ